MSRAKDEILPLLVWTLGTVFFLNVPAEQSRQIASQRLGRLARSLCRPRGQMKEPSEVSKRRT
jgi:hypothetical protein